MGIRHLIILLVIFAGPIQLIDAYADSPVILETEKTSYEAGELITVRGFVEDYDTVEPFDVAIHIKDPKGNTIFVKRIVPNERGVFALQASSIGVLWEPAGKYTITASYDSQQSSTSFDFSGGGFFVPVSPARISTDRQSYSQHDTIKIEGYLRNIYNQFPFDEQSTEIIVWYKPVELSIVFNGPDRIPVFLDTFTPLVDGTFEKNYLLAGPDWIEPGQYTVNLRYENGLKASTSFSFTGGDGSYPKELWPQDSEKQDTVSPILMVPTDFLVDAVDSSGSRVKYSVSAVDDIDDSPSILCVPGSGSTFSIGDNLVRCFASDDSGNSVKKTFTITVMETEHETKDWAKVVAKKWCNDMVSDVQFFNEIEFLIDDNTIDSAVYSDKKIPNWIKTTACWWGDGTITDEEFIKGLEFTIQRGLIPRVLFD